MTGRKHPQPDCSRCGDEGSELCPACLRFLCDGCLDDHEHTWRGEQWPQVWRTYAIGSDTGPHLVIDT